MLKAIDSLPAKSLGFRTYSLPVEEKTRECLEGLAGLSDSSRKIIVGSHEGGSDPELKELATDCGITLLEPDKAAALATHVRNTIKDDEEVEQLIYISSSEQAIASSLEVLNLITSADFARWFAEKDDSELDLLKALSEAGSREISKRLEDLSVIDLAAYAEDVEKEHGGYEAEAYCLPRLGVLPQTFKKGISAQKPTKNWYEKLDQLLGEKKAESIREAIKTIQTLPPDKKELLGEHLIEQHYISGSLTVSGQEAAKIAVKYAERCIDYSRGRIIEPHELKGLSIVMLDLLRGGKKKIDKILEDGVGPDPPPDEERIYPNEQDFFESETELFLKIVGQENLSIETRADESDEGDEVKDVVFSDGDEHIIVNIDLGKDYRNYLYTPDLAQLFETTGYVVCEEPGSFVRDGIAEEKQVTIHPLPEASENLAPDLRETLDRFISARTEFFTALMDILPEPPRDGDEHPEPEELRTLLLTAFPLTAVSRATKEAEAYVDAYKKVLEEFTADYAGGTGTMNPEMLRWMVSLDLLAYEATDGNGEPSTVRLLPLHPLRISRSLTWLQLKETPLFPDVVYTHSNGPQPLIRLGAHKADLYIDDRGRFITDPKGVRAAVSDGIEVTWNLARRALASGKNTESSSSLTMALGVRFKELDHPRDATETLCKELIRLFGQDKRAGAGVHVTLTGITRLELGDEEDEISECLNTSWGDGVSLEICEDPKRNQKVHLEVASVSAGYEGAPRIPDASEGLNVEYIPGDHGNISRIQIQGVTGLTQYEELKTSLGGVDTQRSALGRTDHDEPMEDMLVKTYVCSAAWPINPNPDLPFISYDNVRGCRDMIVTLCHPDVLTTIFEKKRESLALSLDLPLREIRRGALRSQEARKFIKKVIEAEKLTNELRGQAGSLRAIREIAQENPGTKRLVLSLDSNEGKAWAKECGVLFGSSDVTEGKARRSDLLVLEANNERTELTGLRVIEIKSRERRPPTEANLNKWSRQAQVSLSRIRSLAKPEHAEEPALQKLRRLVWMGAGHQAGAKLWKNVLEDFDNRLRGDNLPDKTTAEVYYVHSLSAQGQSEDTRPIPRLNPDGSEGTGPENVRFVKLGSEDQGGSDIDPDPLDTVEDKSDDTWPASDTYTEIEHFITNEMKMQAVNQPVMLKCLLEADDGIVMESDVSAVIGETRGGDYKDVRRYPGDVLIRHLLIRRLEDGVTYELNGFENLSKQERDELIKCCETQIQEYHLANAPTVLTEDQDKGADPESSEEVHPDTDVAEVFDTDPHPTVIKQNEVSEREDTATETAGFDPQQVGADPEHLEKIHGQIIKTLREFGVTALAPESQKIQEGPAFYVARVKPGRGVEDSRITRQHNQIKLKLGLRADQEIRGYIDRGAVCLEIPKNEEDRYSISAEDMWAEFRAPSPGSLQAPLGKDIEGDIVSVDFANTDSPHMLIGGTTGSGKSEAIKTMLLGLCKYYDMDKLKITLIDPKGTDYKRIYKLPQVSDQGIRTAEDTKQVLQAAIDEMHFRFQKFSKEETDVGDITRFNGVSEKKLVSQIIVIDEYHQLVLQNTDREEIENLVVSIAATGRAAGIHLIIATQKPSREVISTTIRSNLPAQLALRTRDSSDSRIILGENGAESLTGKGDALLKMAGRMTRLQCALSTGN